MNGAPDSGTLDLRQLVRVLVRRRWLLILPWLAAVAVGVAAALLLKPIYVSRTTLMLEQPQELTGPLGTMIGGGVSPEQQAGRMREQVQSTVFLRGILTATGMRTAPGVREWALKSARRYPGLAPDQQVDAFLCDYLRTAVEVRRGRGDVFEITVSDFEAARARRLAEAVANQFVAASKAAQLEAARSTQSFSAEQEQIYRRKLAESEARLEAASRLASSGDASQVDAANVVRSRGLLEQANLEVEEQRQKLAGLQSQVQARELAASLTAVSSPRTATLAAELAELDRQFAAVRLSAGPDNDGSGVRAMIARKYGDLQTELEQNAAKALAGLPPDARELLVRTRLAQADLAAKQSGRDEIARQVADYRQRQATSPARDLMLQRLREEVETNRTLYNSFVQQSASSQITEAFQSARIGGSFSVLEPAMQPLAPSRPNRPLIILLALVLGAVVGVATVLVVEQHDESIKDAQEVESILGLPVLGAVPRVPELVRSTRRRGGPADAGLPSGPPGAQAGLLHRLKVESPLGLEFRRVYLKLAKTRGRALPRTLLVTSATRGEGKTTTTACLAITLARELRERVLLVDFDLRSPALHRALGLPSSTWGLAQMLRDRDFDERHVRNTALAQLDFLPAGRTETPAGELVDTAACEWFFQETASRYSLVVVDAPPNLAVPDPLILGRAVEGVIYVIKAGSTIRKAAEYGVRVQREARDNVLGVLLNDAGEVLPSYYGYRAYGYGRASEEAGGA